MQIATDLAAENGFQQVQYMVTEMESLSARTLNTFGGDGWILCYTTAERAIFYRILPSDVSLKDIQGTLTKLEKAVMDDSQAVADLEAADTALAGVVTANTTQTAADVQQIETLLEKLASTPPDNSAAIEQVVTDIKAYTASITTNNTALANAAAQTAPNPPPQAPQA
jgi:hypothetical protein